MKSWLRIATLVALAGVLTVAVATLRSIATGQAEMEKSDRAFDQGDLPRATLHARRAATLYAPAAPHVPAAYERLVAIAVGAEAAGQAEIAQTAWRAVRGAALETRHVHVPHAEELERANENLARLQAQVSVASRPATGGALRARYARALGELEREHGPSTAWTAALLLGYALCACGLAWLAWRGVSREGGLVWSSGRYGLVIALLGVVCSALAVWQA
jgi:hypothetical protein